MNTHGIWDSWTVRFLPGVDGTEEQMKEVAKAHNDQGGHLDRYQAKELPAGPQGSDA